MKRFFILVDLKYLLCITLTKIFLAQSSCSYKHLTFIYIGIDIGGWWEKITNYTIERFAIRSINFPKWL